MYLTESSVLQTALRQVKAVLILACILPVNAHRSPAQELRLLAVAHPRITEISVHSNLAQKAAVGIDLLSPNLHPNPPGTYYKGY